MVGGGMIGRHDAVAVAVGVIAKGDPVAVLESDKSGHGVGAGAVHADLAVVVDGHEGEAWVEAAIDNVDVEAVDAVDRVPAGQGCAAEGIDGELETGGADGLHVDDMGEVANVGHDHVALLHLAAGASLADARALHVAVAGAEQVVGAVLHPAGDVGVGGAAVGRVVLETAVARGIVGRGDDDAVGQPSVAAAVVGQDGVGDDGGGGEAIVVLDDGVDVVGDEDFEGGLLSRARERVGVLAHEEGAGDVVGGAVLADGLRDGGNVGLGEGPVLGRAPMAAGAEADELARVGEVGRAVVVRVDELGDVDEEAGGSGFAGEGREGHRIAPG